MRKKGFITYRKFIRYFSQKLNAKEMHDFEKEIMKDAFDADAYDGLSQLTATEMDEDIKELTKIFVSKSKFKKGYLGWFKYAAVVVVLIGLGIFFMTEIDTRNEIPEPLSVIKQEDTLKIASSSEENVEGFKSNKETINEKVEPESKVRDGILPVEENLISENKIEYVDEMTDLKKINQAEKKIEELQQNIDKKHVVKDKFASLNVKKDEPKITGYAERKFETRIRGIVTIRPNMQSKYAQIGFRDTIFKHQQLKSEKKGRVVYQGKVVDKKGNPIPGVTVLVPGTNLGTTTDIDGVYLLELEKETNELSFCFIGMESQLIALNDKHEINVQLEKAEFSLSEVVVTGYGSSKNNRKSPAPEISQKELRNDFSRYKESILNNIDYSKLENFPGKHRVCVLFKLDAQGEICQVEILNSPFMTLEKELMRVLKKLEYFDKYSSFKNCKIVKEKKLRLIINVE